MTMRRLAVFLVLAVSGCSTTSLEDAAPVSSSAQTGAPATAFSAPGTYPNLNVVPEPAAPQFTQEQIDAEADRLRATRDGVSGGSQSRAVSTSASELRRLGRNHGDDAVRIIEGE